MPEAEDHTYELRGRTIALRPLVPGDYGTLYQMATTGRAAVSWRLRGRSVSPDAFASLLWSDCLAQFVIADRQSEWSTVGLISAFNHDPIARTAYLSVLLSDGLVGATPTLGEAVIVFCRYLRNAFSLRKLYAESTRYALSGLDTLAERFDSVHIEGRLADHLMIDNEFWDLYVLAIYVDAIAREEVETFGTYLAGTDRRTLPGAPAFGEFCTFLRTNLGIELGTEPAGGELLSDLGVDSLGLLECLTAIEQRYGLALPDDQLPSIHSLQDLYSLMGQHATVPRMT